MTLTLFLHLLGVGESSNLHIIYVKCPINDRVDVPQVLMQTPRAVEPLCPESHVTNARKAFIGTLGLSIERSCH